MASGPTWGWEAGGPGKQQNDQVACLCLEQNNPSLCLCLAVGSNYGSVVETHRCPHWGLSPKSHSPFPSHPQEALRLRGVSMERTCAWIKLISKKELMEWRREERRSSRPFLAKKHYKRQSHVTHSKNDFRRMDVISWACTLKDGKAEEEFDVVLSQILSEREDKGKVSRHLPNYVG